ncbi:sigma factor [Cytobacillus sp. FJAT-54145]|uniref:Sigma factor n=1 Tax=Cytobacillus spartinae TaxID=3299023 RepID=A0ABW6KJB6_9BACI
MTEKELFFTYHQDIYRTCYYMLQNKQDAEDTCHEIFMKIFQKDYQSIEKLKPWMLPETAENEAYQLFIIADILTKEEMEKVLLSMLP